MTSSWTVKQMVLALVMVVTGSINTLSTKWADSTKSVGSDGGAAREFDHPFFQAVGMFLGETMCLFAFLIVKYVRRTQRQREFRTLGRGSTERLDEGTPRRRFNPFVFLAPAMCDMLGTSTMYVGLNMTYASSFQMLRGALIVFTGLLSVAFLGRRLRSFQWFGIFAVIVGLIVVGLSDFLATSDKSMDMNAVITGDLLIIVAQVITATQMVLEERFVNKLNVAPLLAVGCEGVFGFFILGTLLLPMYYIRVPSTFTNSPEHRLEDVVDAFVQISNSWQIIVAVIGNVCSIAFFNFAGISVTKELSATTRTVLDSVRTLVVWVFSLAVRWQSFHYLQPIGFVVLVVGMFIYNDIIFTPFLRRKGLLNDDAAASTDDDDAAASTDDDNGNKREAVGNDYQQQDDAQTTPRRVVGLDNPVAVNS